MRRNKARRHAIEGLQVLRLVLRNAVWGLGLGFVVSEAVLWNPAVLCAGGVRIRGSAGDDALGSSSFSPEHGTSSRVHSGGTLGY